jgi:hypothetical protein
VNQLQNNLIDEPLEDRQEIGFSETTLAEVHHNPTVSDS